MRKVVTNTGETVRALGVFYKAIIQTVLLYGSNNLVVIGYMLKLIEGFHNWAAICTEVMMERRTTSGD